MQRNLINESMVFLQPMKPNSNSLLPPMILLCTSYDPIVPGTDLERIYNGFITEVERT